MAKRKLSYIEHLTNSPKKRATYFWARRGISFLLAGALHVTLKPFLGDIFSVILGVISFFIIYVVFSHYLALFVMALEDMLSGGK